MYGVQVLGLMLETFKVLKVFKAPQEHRAYKEQMAVE